jgi:hypothetical protein
MFRELRLVAVAAVALGGAALAPTPAAAWYVGYHHSWWGPRFYFGAPVSYGYGNCYVRELVPRGDTPRLAGGFRSADEKALKYYANLRKSHARRDGRKQLRASRVGNGSLERNTSFEQTDATEPVMIGIQADDSEQMDTKTSRSICNAVGERLQKDLRPERSDLSPRLRDLLNELRRQDEH